MASPLFLILCFGLMICRPALMDYPMMITDHQAEAGIKLHRPDGSVFFVNGKTIGIVREPGLTENGNAVIVFATGGTQAVRETVQEVIDMLTAEGAH